LFPAETTEAAAASHHRGTAGWGWVGAALWREAGCLLRPSQPLPQHPAALCLPELKFKRVCW